MNAVLKLLLTAGLVFGLHYGIKHFVGETVRAELGEPPPAVTITVDPAALAQAQKVGRGFDNSAQRSVIEEAGRRIDEMNRNMPLSLPIPGNSAGLPRR